MYDRGTKIIKVSPQIETRVIPEALFHDLVVFLVSIEQTLGDYVLALEVIIPEIAKNEAELAESREVGTVRCVPGL
jgi:hypothetical protein